MSCDSLLVVGVRKRREFEMKPRSQAYSFLGGLLEVSSKPACITSASVSMNVESHVCFLLI